MDTMRDPRTPRRFALIARLTALLALFLSVGLIGSAFAQTDPTGQDEATPTDEDTSTTTSTAGDSYQDFLDQLAANLGGTDAAALDAAIRTTLKQTVDARLAAGEISANAADALKQQIDTADVPLRHVGLIGGRLGGGLDGLGRGGFGHGRGHGPLDGPFGEVGRGFGRGAMALDLDALASFLGVSVDDLQLELRQGMSLGEVAAAQGKSRDELRAFLTEQVQDNLDALMDAGAGTETGDDTATPAAGTTAASADTTSV